MLEVDWYQDARFMTNPARVQNRQLLCDQLTKTFANKTCTHWLDTLNQASPPCGPINNVVEALATPQVKVREIIVDFTIQNSPVKVLDNPIKLSASPLIYRTARRHYA